jgi:hypothetical protein
LPLGGDQYFLAPIRCCGPNGGTFILGRSIGAHAWDAEIAIIGTAKIRMFLAFVSLVSLYIQMTERCPHSLCPFCAIADYLARRRYARALANARREDEIWQKMDKIWQEESDG